MVVKSGETASADEVMNALGTNFVDISQLIFNAKYIGFSSKLTNSGVPNLDNVFYSTFEADDAEVNYGFNYNATDDLYRLPDLSGVLNYVIIEATSYDRGWTNGTNDVYITPIGAGTWLVYATTGTSEVQKAKVHKSLWWGDGTGSAGSITKTETPAISDFTSVTAVKVSDAGDVGKQAHMADGYSSNTGAGTITGTFADTSTNTNCNSWSYVTVNADGSTINARWEVPDATLLNLATSSSGGDVSDETELDMSADDKNNPATCQVALETGGTINNKAHGVAIVLSKGQCAWVDSGVTTATTVNYFADDSIPLFTAADTLANEGAEDGILIFKDTAAASCTNTIASINSSIDATSSEQISISANGGSNWTNVNNGEIARPIAGTALWRRIVITRADTSKEDIVTEQAVKYNFY